MPFPRIGWRVATGGGLLVSIALLVVSETLLRPEQEILYTGSLFSHCVPAKEGEICIARYSVSIANNGRAGRDDVRLEIGRPLRDWVADTRASDLVGSTVARPDPEIGTSIDDEKTVYDIRRFAPNTVVDFEIGCQPCSRAQIRALKDAPLRVHAKGAVVNTDPRTTMLGRAMRNLARVLSIFG
jgi:hypothetical protein